MTKRRPAHLRFLSEMEPGWCIECDKRLPDIRHVRRQFCSKACNNAHFNGLEAQARAEERAKLTCVECGGPIRNAKKLDKKYCSWKCQRSGPHMDPTVNSTK